MPLTVFSPPLPSSTWTLSGCTRYVCVASSASSSSAPGLLVLPLSSTKFCTPNPSAASTLSGLGYQMQGAWHSLYASLASHFSFIGGNPVHAQSSTLCLWHRRTSDGLSIGSVQTERVNSTVTSLPSSFKLAAS